MFEAILERLLKRILGEYFEGFDSNNIGMALWSGEVVIQNVRLKATAMSKLNLPLFLKYSFIRSLRMKIPWKSLTSSKIEIYFDGLYRCGDAASKRLGVPGYQSHPASEKGSR